MASPRPVTRGARRPLDAQAARLLSKRMVTSPVAVFKRGDRETRGGADVPVATFSDDKDSCAINPGDISINHGDIDIY